MKEIKIISEGKTSGRIFSGEAAADIKECLKDCNEIFVVYDEAVRKFAERIVSDINGSAGASGKHRVMAELGIRTSEKHKNIDTVTDICGWLLENNADRNALLLGIGGGITTDITGFAASIYKRGIRFAFVPTTLLAQVDAAIGGKTGVNFRDYKNMLGVIRQPEFTFECLEVLETLPYKDFISGSAEMLKTFIIENRNGNYEKAVKIFAAIYSSKNRIAAIRNYKSELSELIHAAAEVKAGIVGRDQFELGERKKLNLGHTFGHAIEWQANVTDDEMETAGTDGNFHKMTDISHGEAVAMGIVLAAKLSERLGICDLGGLSEKIVQDFVSCGLPTKSPFGIRRLAEAMKKDKKAESGIVRFILIKNIGEVIVKDLEPDNAINIIEDNIWFA